MSPGTPGFLAYGPAIGCDVYDRGSGSSSPSEEIAYLLAEAGRAVDALMAERPGMRLLGPLHQTVLRTLADLGPHARLDLAEQLQAAPAAVAQAVDDLLAQGLMQAMVINLGGRHEVVALTPAGVAALTTMRNDLESLHGTLLASLTKGERAQLRYLLRRIRASATRAGVL
ncbi:MarR family winged helix-turn-helix transcriptional regulator [Streptomyces sp. NBC_01264]|uniref:MarR family winged helix-turn-helix transcriptional regulator n=1 Tax=Streptomyces sp. NBC_01264 TaxID=2903804 RepID=UPI002255FB79|nr:MarR family winged helix-turn-helix transcriptional regulator [Streptomyces sp. NBC_01264]MCX4775986.1 MarR family winged helix-turn-helix transcriptional regulator [Streptomyces sp. NBC_01264]